MTQQTATVPDLTIREAGLILGGISEYTMRQKVARGEFPNAYRAGNRIRIPAADVDDYRERNRLIEPARPRSTRSEGARRGARRRTA